MNRRRVSHSIRLVGAIPTLTSEVQRVSETQSVRRRRYIARLLPGPTWRAVVRHLPRLFGDDEYQMTSTRRVPGIPFNALQAIAPLEDKDETSAQERSAVWCPGYAEVGAAAQSRRR